MRAHNCSKMILAMFLLAGLSVGREAFAEVEETRMALVIGNAAYTAPLQTSSQDAQDFAASLREMKFKEATFLPNAGLLQMRAALKAFAEKATTADAVLFYFAGHGVQVANRNYLIPIDAHIQRLQDIPQVALALDEVYDVMADLPAPTKLVILDACRDNPFGQAVARWPRGLAKPTNAPPGTMTIFAAEPGATARDGRTDHSPFTGAFLYFMTEPGLELHSLYIAVRNSVASGTSDGQIPYQDGSPGMKFYFRDPAWIEGTVLAGDDEVLVLVNGDEKISWNSDGNRSILHKIDLKGGRNDVIIKVFNQSTFVGGCSWLRQGYEDLRRSIENWGIRLPDNLVQPPEGWNFAVRFRRGSEDVLPLLLQGGEEVPQPSRHGKMFTVSKATITVDRKSGAISFEGVETKLW